MTPTQLSLTRLLGKKELTFGCVIKNPDMKDEDARIMKIISVDEDDGETYALTYRGQYDNFVPSRLVGIKGIEIIGLPPTLTDLFRWICTNDHEYAFPQIFDDCIIFYGKDEKNARVKIPFDLTVDLLDQSEETLKSIINLIESNGN